MKAHGELLRRHSRGDALTAAVMTDSPSSAIDPQTQVMLELADKLTLTP